MFLIRNTFNRRFCCIFYINCEHCFCCVTTLIRCRYRHCVTTYFTWCSTNCIRCFIKRYAVRQTFHFICYCSTTVIFWLYCNRSNFCINLLCLIRNTFNRWFCCIFHINCECCRFRITIFICRRYRHCVTAYFTWCSANCVRRFIKRYTIR